MRRRDKASRTGVKAQHGKTLTRRNPPKAARRRGPVTGDVRDELDRRTRELNEALERQAATAEILSVISSSPTDTQPVFDCIVQSGLKLFPSALISVALRDVDKVSVAAIADADPDRAEAWRRTWPIPLRGDYFHGAAILDCRIVDLPDVKDAPAEFAAGARNFLTSGHRAITIMPMMRSGEAIGLLSVVRLAPGPLSDKQLAVLRTFAAQAVIAIENTRLLKELHQRTDDLSELLQQQTATSEVLRVISSSPTNVQPVFDAIAESAVRLCDGQFSFVLRFDGKVMDFASCCGLSAKGLDAFHSILPMPASEDTAAGRAIVRRAVVAIPDVEADLSYGAVGQGLAKAVTYRSIAAVPLLREGNPIGAIAVARANAGSFPRRQIALLQAFADQAVIAIGNVRLFDEVQARTRELSESLEQQTATSEVLKIISSSPGELEPVFKAMLENATRLCEAHYGTMWLCESDAFRAVSLHGPLPQAYIDLLRSGTLFRPGSDTPTGRVVQTHQPVQVLDLRETRAYLDREPMPVAAVEVAGVRTMFSVPMLKEDQLVGTISIYRQEMLPFTKKQIELVQNFAAQAVIAIENARLLSELRQRTTDLSRSLEDLRTTQDRLVQTEKLASLGQLTAGIAHEIKNPLNFVNNFSGVSAELIDELQDTLKGTDFDDKARAEITDLTNTLRGNLDKVVQHGKRADAIVKNMLLHSREGSGERRPVDINALVEESLNLAYHGARAEKRNFDVMVEQSLDPAAGEVDLFPQEITRVLLNLISNGVYATAKKAHANDESYKPTLIASTKSLDGRVEIKIRDNGTGIPPEIKDKMFNPFFTTKPAGEGTGLGLSISHDIVVKQHGGSIEVDTQPGEFTEIRVILPRAAALLPGRS